jgi:hypothetical protein
MIVETKTFNARFELGAAVPVCCVTISLPVDVTPYSITGEDAHIVEYFSAFMNLWAARLAINKRVLGVNWGANGESLNMAIICQGNFSSVRMVIAFAIAQLKPMPVTKAMIASATNKGAKGCKGCLEAARLKLDQAMTAKGVKLAIAVTGRNVFAKKTPAEVQPIVQKQFSKIMLNWKPAGKTAECSTECKKSDPVGPVAVYKLDKGSSALFAHLFVTLKCPQALVAGGQLYCPGGGFRMTSKDKCLKSGLSFLTKVGTKGALYKGYSLGLFSAYRSYTFKNEDIVKASAVGN